MDGNDRRFYVYGYYDADGTPFYIGKGTGNRMRTHANPWNVEEYIQAVDRRLLAMKQRGEAWECHIIQDGLTEPESLQLEYSLIQQWGRLCLDSGPLENQMMGQDSHEDHFIASLRPIARLDAKTGALLKRYNPQYDGGKVKEPLQLISADGFNFAGVKQVLYGVKQQYRGCRWAFVRRTPEELVALRTFLAKREEVRRTEESRRRLGYITIRTSANASRGRFVECEITGPRIGGTHIFVRTDDGTDTIAEIRRRLYRAVRRANKDGIDWHSLVDAALAQWIGQNS